MPIDGPPSLDTLAQCLRRIPAKGNTSQSAWDILNNCRVLQKRAEYFRTLRSCREHLSAGKDMDKSAFLKQCTDAWRSLNTPGSYYQGEKSVVTDIDVYYEKLLQKMALLYAFIFASISEYALTMNVQVPTSFPDDWFENKSYKDLATFVDTLPGE